MGNARHLGWPLPNVWLGTSVEDQKRADERIPHLLRCPAAVRFLSVEPLLGPVDLSPWLKMPCGNWPNAILGDHLCNLCRDFAAAPIDWVIVGGESGTNARPCDLAWVRSIVGQCKAAGVPVFVKQLGAVPFDSRAVADLAVNGAAFHRENVRDKKGGDWSEWPADLRVREFPSVATFAPAASAGG